MARNDIHAPSVIVPADYQFVGLSARAWEYGAYPEVVLTERQVVLNHLIKTGGKFSDHEHGGSCHVCGAHAIYLAVFHHPKTNTYIRTGMDCAEKLGMQDANRFKKFKDVIKAAQHHRAGKKKAQGLLQLAGLSPAWDLYAKFVAFPEDENGFIQSIKANPADTFRRQVYADWLEASDRKDQADKVRAGFPVERVGLPFPQGAEGDVIRCVGGTVRYGSLSDYWAGRIRKNLEQLGLLTPVAPVAVPVAVVPVSQPAKPTYPEYLETVVPGAYAVYEAQKANPVPYYPEKTVADIVSKGMSYGTLTTNQINFVKKLLADIANRPAPAPAVPVVAVTNDMTPVMKLFKAAAAHLKRPKVRLQTPNGSPVVLALAGDKSKYKGMIMVTDGGKYGDSKWFGVVNLDGTWKDGRDKDAAVLALVKEFAADPVKVATNYGKLTNHCCFCDKALTDERSVGVGYGGTCAKHFGLPWGDTTPYAVVAEKVLEAAAV